MFFVCAFTNLAAATKSPTPKTFDDRATIADWINSISFIRPSIKSLRTDPQVSLLIYLNQAA